MKVRDEHFYIGASLLQVAEHASFTAINALKVDKESINNAFKINDHIGLYCKYASSPIGKYKEYLFTFQKEHLENIEKLRKSCTSVYFALICVDAREICCISLEQFDQLVSWRKADFGQAEARYQILVTAPPGKSLRAYINASGKKGRFVGEKLIISRTQFPEIIFS